LRKVKTVFDGGHDGILRPVVNRPVADEQPNAKSADAIGAQDAILPHYLPADCSLARNTRTIFRPIILRMS